MAVIRDLMSVSTTLTSTRRDQIAKAKIRRQLQGHPPTLVGEGCPAIAAGSLVSQRQSGGDELTQGHRLSDPR
jgi:hypothetical protein